MEGLRVTPRTWLMEQSALIHSRPGLAEQGEEIIGADGSPCPPSEQMILVKVSQFDEDKIKKSFAHVEPWTKGENAKLSYNLLR